MTTATTELETSFKGRRTLPQLSATRPAVGPLSPSASPCTRGRRGGPGRRRFAFVLGIFFAAFVRSRLADAQCGANRTTCSTCHDGTQAPAPAADAWHRDHAFADLCATCHGGRGDGRTMEDAHAGLVDPIGDPVARCGTCHSGASEVLAARYPRGSAARGDATAPRSADPRRRRSTRSPHGEAVPNLALTMVIALVAVLGGASVAHRERGARRSGSVARTRIGPPR